jgi:hypothetical protein
MDNMEKILSTGTLTDLPLCLALYQNVISFHQMIGFTMKFIYSLITKEPQIDEKHQISP